MDAIFPYLVRNTPAAEPTQRLIEPVRKYTRFTPDEHGHHHEIWQYRISEQQAQSEQKKQQQQQQSEQASASDDTGEPHYLQTCHASTPESEQHADADGHLDIYI